MLSCLGEVRIAEAVTCHLLPLDREPYTEPLVSTDRVSIWTVLRSTECDTRYIAMRGDSMPRRRKAVALVLLSGAMLVAAGCSMLNSQPVALFTASTTAGSAPLLVEFDASLSLDTDGGIESYSWSFGDGKTAIRTASETTPLQISHVYAVAGVYTATLTIVDGRGSSSSSSIGIEVSTPSPTSPSNIPPAAVLSASPTSGEAPLAVTFDASGSTDPDGAISSYTWDFGDGTTGTGDTISHTYSPAGSYEAVLVVTDDQGATDVTGQSVVVNGVSLANQPPEASFSALPVSGEAPLTVNFDAAASADADGIIGSYVWDFGDGGSDTGLTATHVYADAGDYLATLTVEDDDGATDTATEPVTVLAPPDDNEPPEIFSFHVTPGPRDLYGVPAEAHLQFECGDSDGVVARWELDTGDGAIVSGVPESAYVNEIRPNFHTYVQPGPKRVVLTVWDDFGESVSAVVTACPVTKEIQTGRISLDGQDSPRVNRGVAFAGNELVVSSSAGLLTIDLPTAEVTSVLPVSAVDHCGYLAFDGTSMWVCETNRAIASQIDLETGELESTCQLPGENGLAFDGEYLWNVHNTSAMERMVSRIDRETGGVVYWFRYEDYGSLGDIAYDGEYLWLAYRQESHSPRFIQVDPSTGESIAMFQFPSSSLALGGWGMCARDGLLWILRSIGSDSVSVVAVNPDLWIGWNW